MEKNKDNAKESHMYSIFTPKVQGIRTIFELVLSHF